MLSTGVPRVPPSSASAVEPLAVPELELPAAAMWTPCDGRHEVHITTPAPRKRPGANAKKIEIDALYPFADGVGDMPLDCILEVKDK